MPFNHNCQCQLRFVHGRVQVVHIFTMATCLHSQAQGEAVWMQRFIIELGMPSYPLLLLIQPVSTDSVRNGGAGTGVVSLDLAALCSALQWPQEKFTRLISEAIKQVSKARKRLMIQTLHWHPLPPSFYHHSVATSGHLCLFKGIVYRRVSCTSPEIGAPRSTYVIMRYSLQITADEWIVDGSRNTLRRCPRRSI